VKNRDGSEETLFSHQTEQLVLCGNISVTQPALSLLLEENIDTILLRANGGYLGRLVGEGPKNVELRRKQFLLSGTEDERLVIAKSIVRGKLKNGSPAESMGDHRLR
jgi:CRISPR-associated protein Cas1